MTPEDKEFARKALEKGWLTIDQVAALREEVERTGRPLEAIATERGLAPPEPAPQKVEAAKPTPPARLPRGVPEAILGAALLVMAALLYLSIRSFQARQEDTEEVAERTSRAMAEAEDMYQKSLRKYQEGRAEQREQEAEEALARGRAALAAAESRGGTLDPELYIHLSRAVQGLSVYLESHPRDEAARLERSRAWELRGEYDKALQDLQDAVKNRPPLEASVRERLQALRAKAKR